MKQLIIKQTDIHGSYDFIVSQEGTIVEEQFFGYEDTDIFHVIQFLAKHGFLNTIPRYLEEDSVNKILAQVTGFVPEMDLDFDDEGD
jgi:hypothetical protein